MRLKNIHPYEDTHNNCIHLSVWWQTPIRRTLICWQALVIFILYLPPALLSLLSRDKQLVRGLHSDSRHSAGATSQAHSVIRPLNVEILHPKAIQSGCEYKTVIKRWRGASQLYWLHWRTWTNHILDWQSKCTHCLCLIIAEVRSFTQN